MKKTIFFITLYFSILGVKIAVAKGVDIKTATRVSETFTSARNQILRIQAIRRGKPLEEVNQYNVSNTTRLIDEETKEVLAYIIHLKPNGFIAVSTNTAIKPIVAFSFNSNFFMDDNPNNILYHMLKLDMRYRLLAIPLIDEKVKNQNKESWHEYLTDAASILESQSTTQQWPEGDNDGWLDTTWRQSGIYNDSCPDDPVTDPWDNTDDGLCLTGCVATAMAQIINYWEFPDSVSFDDSDNYRSIYDPDNSGSEPERRIWLDLNPDGQNDGEENYEYEYNPNLTSINYNVNNNHPSNQTIADLMYACGVSVDMRYSDIRSVTSTSSVANALTGKFGYDFAEVKDPDINADFYDELENNMKNGQPAQLSIERSDGSGDHSIVCDGYRDDDTYHLNFGWGSGNPDNITQACYSLPTGMPSGYSVVKYGVVNIRPYQITNNDPILSNPRVNPMSGIEYQTEFEFMVDYYDPDGDPPSHYYRRVTIIGNGGHDGTMTLKSGLASNGTYHYTTVLPVGSHSYMFAFADEHGALDTTLWKSGPYVYIPGCGIELKVEVSSGPVTNNIKIQFGYGPDLQHLENQQWLAPDLPENLWIESEQQLMFTVNLESNNHTFIKWEFRDDDGTLVRESTASSYGFILLSGNIHATAYLSYTPIDYTISGTVLRNDSTLVPGGVDLELSSSQQTMTQHTDDGNFLFTGVHGGVSFTITPSTIGYGFSPSNVVFNNLRSNQAVSFIAYSSDAYAPITSFLSVPDSVTEDSSVLFSWIGEDDVSAPETLLYQYKLEGVDADWSD